MQHTGAIRNFLFHRVNPERDRLWDPMDVQRFDRCMKYISSHYVVALLEDIVQGKVPVGRKKFATLSFDDGYKDNIQYAAPILKKYNCKASFYVVIECIEKNIPTWTHITEHCFLFTNINDLQVDFDFIPTQHKLEGLNTEDKRIAYVKKIIPFMKTLTNEQRELFFNGIVKACTDIELPKVMMNWDDLRELKRQGHYIGSHTITHPMLATVTDENDLKNELLNAAKHIEKELGHFPYTISYPGGSYSAATIKASKEAGYKMGLAVKQDLYYPGKDDVFEIPRIILSNESWIKIYLRLTHILERIKILIRYR